MIVDVSNTIGKHLFKDNILATDLLSKMDKAKIDICVIHSYGESEDNESVSLAIKQYPDRFIGLYTINPWRKNSALEFENAILNEGFKGLYLNPLRHGYLLSEIKVYYPLLDVCKKYNLPVWIYGAAEVFCNPIFFDKIAEDYPELNIIMGKMGLQYDNSSAINVAKKHSNIFLETSGSMDFNVSRAIKSLGSNKILLGTGTPDEGYFELEIFKIKKSSDNKSDIENILFKNSFKIFNIEEMKK